MKKKKGGSKASACDVEVMLASLDSEVELDFDETKFEDWDFVQ